MARTTPLPKRTLRQLTPTQLLAEQTRFDRACVAERNRARSDANRAALERGVHLLDPEFDQIVAEAWQRPPKSQSKLEAVRAEIQRRYDAGDPALDRTALNLANRALKETLSAAIPAPQSGGAVPPSPHYRSHVKRAIELALLKNPTATDLEVCRTLDADGSVPLPKNWKPQPADRSFVQAYRDSRTQNRVEVTISTVRKDLRKVGICP